MEIDNSSSRGVRLAMKIKAMRETGADIVRLFFANEGSDHDAEHAFNALQESVIDRFQRGFFGHAGTIASD
jgi:hypothetical protein